MPSLEEQIAQLETAIGAQEGLRPVIGDAAVEVALSALRARLDALRAQREESPRPRTGHSPEQLLVRVHSYLPRELAEKMRATGRIEGERKQVTVLFADLSGFTALSERLDPEEVVSLTHEALKEMAQAVYQYEGYIDKFIGDAIMAVFGAPVAHEDDPERALRAALAMRERLEHFNRRFGDRLVHPLSLHMGINTGPVIAGNIGSDLRLSYTVMGDTVNTASRLEGAARAGQILVSRETHRLTHEAFSFEALAPIQVKGKREPLPVFELQRARILPGKTRGLRDLSPAFVGRERELLLLREVARTLDSGRGRIVTLTGDAGLGKSRLLAEWRARLGSGVRWLEGRALAHTTSLSYGPFIDLFRRYAGIQDDDPEARARARLREVVEKRFPGNAEAHALFAHALAMRLTPDESALLASRPAEVLRRTLFNLVGDSFAAFATRRPTWLILEDLHWADTSSVELLVHLLPLVLRLPLAIISVSRQHTSGTPGRLRDAIQDGFAELHTRIELSPLTGQSSLGMVAQLLFTHALPENLKALILEKAEGNPFFVEELIRSLIERGALKQVASGEWVTTPLLDTLTVPDTLQGVLMARLDRLPDRTRWVAQQASVIGRIFLDRVLRQIADDASKLDDDLEHLAREGLVRERARQPEVEYIFKHALTQEAAYQSLLGPRRKELHRKVGEVMEALFADRLEELRSILGEHFLRGEAWEKAAGHFMLAGDAAARLYAQAEARQHYARALEALGRLPDVEDTCRRRVDAILKQVAVSFADDPAQNVARLTEAEALASRLPAPEGPDRAGAETAPRDWRCLSRVLFWKGRSCFYRNKMREALECFQQMLSMAQEHEDGALLSTSAMMIARVMLFQGFFHRAEKLAAQSLDPLESAGDWQEWIWTVGYHGAALSARGQPSLGLSQVQRGLARALEMKHVTGIGASRILLAICHLMSGDMARMQEEGRALVAIAEHSRDRMYVYLGHGFQGWAEGRLGHHEKARANLERSQAILAGLGGRLAAMDWFAAARAELALLAGRPREAVDLAAEAVALGQASGGMFAEGLAQRVWGQALVALGSAHREAAHSHLAASLRSFEGGEALLEAARTRVVWGCLCRDCGEPSAAAEHLELAATQFESAGLLDELARTRRLHSELKWGRARGA